MANQYPNTGALFRNDRDSNPKAPAWRGDIELDADLLRALVGVAKEGKPIKIQLAGWEKETKAGATFISVKAEMPREKKPEPKFTPSSRDDDDDEIPF